MIEDRLSIAGDAHGTHLDAGGLAVVVEAYLIVPFFVELGIGVPIERTSVVHFLRRWWSRCVVGMIEFIRFIYAWDDNPSVSERGTGGVVKHSHIIYDDVREPIDALVLYSNRQQSNKVFRSGFCTNCKFDWRIWAVFKNHLGNS